jgi:TAG lipase/lysophosphatidylethanolamine acyltransferase
MIQDEIVDMLLGLYHIGVVKALFEQDLLPRIISGTAVGALIAALICIHTDDELPVSKNILIK